MLYTLSGSVSPSPLGSVCPISSITTCSPSDTHAPFSKLTHSYCSEQIAYLREFRIIWLGHPQFLYHSNLLEYVNRCHFSQYFLFLFDECLNNGLILGIIHCSQSGIDLLKHIFLNRYPAVGHDLLHLVPTIIKILVQISHHLLYYRYCLLHGEWQQVC